MTLRDLQSLLDFHYWARDRMFEALAPLRPEQFLQPSVGSFGSLRDTVVHIYSADWVWAARWAGESPASMVDPVTLPDLAAIRSAWEPVEARTRALVSTLGEAGIQRPMEYHTLDGRRHAEVFWHMVQHVVNHGTYHRGQVTTLLRQLAVAPPPSNDLITYYRARQGH